jgi:hypothetical protein
MLFAGTEVEPVFSYGARNVPYALARYCQRVLLESLQPLAQLDEKIEEIPSITGSFYTTQILQDP